MNITPIIARALEFGFSWQLISRQEIVELAEQDIARSDDLPSAELCELAVCRRDYELHEALRAIHRDKDWRVIPFLRVLFGIIRPFNDSSENEIDMALSGLAGLGGWDNHYGLSGFWNLNLALETAKTGVYGNVQELRDEARDLFYAYFGLKPSSQI